MVFIVYGFVGYLLASCAMGQLNKQNHISELIFDEYYQYSDIHVSQSGKLHFCPEANGTTFFAKVCSVCSPST